MKKPMVCSVSLLFYELRYVPLLFGGDAKQPVGGNV